MESDLLCTGSTHARINIPTIRLESNRRWALCLLLLVLFASACAGTPTGPPFQPPEPPPDHRARLILYRTDQQGSLASVEMTIDGRDLGRIRNHEYETLLLTPGTHILRARLRGFGLLAWGWNSHRFRMNEGGITYLEISVRLAARDSPDTRELDIGGRGGGAASENTFIVPKSAQEALSDLEATTRVGRTGSVAD